MPLLQIGITGGIGAGKSLISRIFSCLGTPVYDADSRAKYVMTTDGILLSRIRKEFGELSFNADGSLNRAYLSEKVFNDAEKLSVLNSLVHPRVAEDYMQWIEKHKRYPYVLKEAALLFESGSYKQLDKVILVYAPETLRIQRVMRRDPQRSESQVREIMTKQMHEEEKLKRADAVIWNDETRLVIPAVLELHNQFISAK
jgi:dephospho-CoA kinase